MIPFNLFFFLFIFCLNYLPIDDSVKLKSPAVTYFRTYTLALPLELFVLQS